MSLYWYIRSYIPRGWKSPIGEVAFVPRLDEDQIEEMRKVGVEDFMRVFANGVYNKWYYVEAIESYLSAGEVDCYG